VARRSSRFWQLSKPLHIIRGTASPPQYTFPLITKFSFSSESPAGCGTPDLSWYAAAFAEKFVIDADARRYLASKGLAEATIRRRCGVARQFFRAGVRKGHLPSNPFTDLKSANLANPARECFITQAQAQKVLDACPDAEWRLIFALSRFGGLRCPSEHLALTWGDIRRAEGRFTVHSPKTEHHPGGESRQVPLFPELLPHLREVFELAEPGAEYVITRYRRSSQNLSTQLRRIIKRAGLTPWPKLYQNLRASRETELAGQFPHHVVCAWIGNSQAVAAKHYLQVTEDHFRSALQNALQQAPTLNRNESQAEGQDAPEPAFSQAIRDSSTDCDKSEKHLVEQIALSAKLSLFSWWQEARRPWRPRALGHRPPCHTCSRIWYQGTVTAAPRVCPRPGVCRASNRGRFRRASSALVTPRAPRPAVDPSGILPVEPRQADRQTYLPNGHRRSSPKQRGRTGNRVAEEHERLTGPAETVADVVDGPVYEARPCGQSHAAPIHQARKVGVPVADGHA